MRCTCGEDCRDDAATAGRHRTDGCRPPHPRRGRDGGLRGASGVDGDRRTRRCGRRRTDRRPRRGGGPLRGSRRSKQVAVHR
ncbi:hypothetical protein E0W80_00885 [Microbacterium sp. PI-1]|nr:hypothetical protein E0W80_00885 [Microbacterium sp. PI-1]